MLKFLVFLAFSLLASRCLAGETAITLSYGPTYKATQIPNNKTNHGVNIGVVTTNINRFDTWHYGQNFFNLGVGQSDPNDPAARATHGSLLIFFSERMQLSGNQVAGEPLFHIGVLNDVRLDAAFEYAAKNNRLQTRRKAIVIGPNFAFDVPGYFYVGLHYVKEWNNNGIFRRAVSYKPTFETVLTGMQPLGFTGLPLRYEGLLNVTLPKGEDGFHAKTVTSLLVQNRLVLDIGSLILKRPKLLDTFIGFQYWLNKTGDNHVIKSGAVEETVFFGTTVHF